MKEGSSDVCVTANLVLTTPFTTPLQILNRLKQVPPRSVPLHSLARSQAVAPTGASGAFETSEPAHRFLPPVLAGCPYSTYTLPGTSDQWWLCEAFYDFQAAVILGDSLLLLESTPTLYQSPLLLWKQWLLFFNSTKSVLVAFLISCSCCRHLSPGVVLPAASMTPPTRDFPCKGSARGIRGRLGVVSAVRLS